MKFSTKNLTKAALVAAIYVAVTILIAPISYGEIQFRISEILTLLCFYNPIYIPAIGIGVLLSNISSPLGPIDMLVGTMHSLISVYCMHKSKNIYVASLFPSLFSFIIGLEIALMAGDPSIFLPATLWIMLSEFIIVSLIGVAIFKVLEKNKNFYNTVLLDEE